MQQICATIELSAPSAWVVFRLHTDEKQLGRDDWRVSDNEKFADIRMEVEVHRQSALKTGHFVPIDEFSNKNEKHGNLFTT